MEQEKHPVDTLRFTIMAAAIDGMFLRMYRL